MHIPLAALVCALLAAGLIACGGDGGADEDPQQVLEETFSNDQSIDSGRADLRLSAKAEGGDAGGTFEASVSGPFEASETEGGVPSFDLQVEVSGESGGQSLSFSGGVTSTGDKGFVNYQDTDYELDRQTFGAIEQLFASAKRQSEDQGDKGGLAAFGVDPRNWLTDLSNEGTTDVEGTETIQISGRVDIRKLFEDLAAIARKAGRAAAGRLLTPVQIDQLEKSVKSADFSVFSGADDRLLRRIEGTFEIEPVDTDTSAPDALTLEFSLTLVDVNEPQEIAAPSSARPLAELLRQLGLPGSPTDILGAAGSAAAGAGIPSPPSSESSRAYLDCLSTAEGPEALQKCGELLER